MAALRALCNSTIRVRRRPNSVRHATGCSATGSIRSYDFMRVSVLSSPTLRTVFCQCTRELRHIAAPSGRADRKEPADSWSKMSTTNTKSSPNQRSATPASEFRRETKRSVPATNATRRTAQHEQRTEPWSRDPRQRTHQHVGTRTHPDRGELGTKDAPRAVRKQWPAGHDASRHRGQGSKREALDRQQNQRTAPPTRYRSQSRRKPGPLAPYSEYGQDTPHIVPDFTAAASEGDGPQTFAECGVDATYISSLSKLGILTPTHIQKLALPQLLESFSDRAGRCKLIHARTATGKTLCYLIPLLHHLGYR